jgi:hypothetical protein
MRLAAAAVVVVECYLLFHSHALLFLSWRRISNHGERIFFGGGNKTSPKTLLSNVWFAIFFLYFSVSDATADMCLWNFLFILCGLILLLLLERPPSWIETRFKCIRESEEEEETNLKKKTTLSLSFLIKLLCFSIVSTCWCSQNMRNRRKERLVPRIFSFSHFRTFPVDTFQTHLPKRCFFFSLFSILCLVISGLIISINRLSSYLFLSLSSLHFLSYLRFSEQENIYKTLWTMTTYL